MSIGAEMLLKKYKGSSLAIAEALIMGNLEVDELDHVGGLVSQLMLQTAKIRLEGMGKLNPADIKPA